MSALKKFAKTCSSAGWFIFPLRPKSKEPDGALAPQGFKSASNDFKQIEAWWDASPEANIGIDLGRSKLTVLDFDNGEPPAEFLPYLNGRSAVKTARGLHVYFTGVNKQQKMYYGGKAIGDVKSAGGYVLGPFSVHPDGPVYEVIKTDDGSKGTLDTIPDELLKLITAVAHEPVNASPDGPKIPFGLHDTELHRIAGKLRSLGMEEEAIYTALLEICEKRCENYGSDYKEMCRKHAHNICKKPPTDGSIALNQQPDAPKIQMLPDVSKWQEQFRSIGEMEDRPIDEIIRGALQEGVCFIGANPGDGKTLTALAFAKAISTGEPLFGLPQFSVAKPRTVIYLIPETRDAAFRKRCESFRLPDDKTKFMCRTTSVGLPLELSDPYLMQAVRETKAVIFLDTASRFMKTTDENSAAQNRMLMNDVQALLAAGAVCVVLIHHATKAAQQESMTLENMLRGTGDFAAMCDQAYGIRKDRVAYASGNGPMEIELVSLKDREQIGQLTTLRLAASRLNKERGIFPTVSIIDETGNFKVVGGAEIWTRTIDALVSLVARDSQIPAKEIARQIGGVMTEYKVKSELGKLGWHRVQGGKGGASPWHLDNGGPCPYGKVEPQSTEAPEPPKSPKRTVEEAIRFLHDLLVGTEPDGEYVPEAEVYQEADKRGISDGLIGRARKRLGVVVGKDKGWSLPTPEPVLVSAETAPTVN